MILKFLTFLLVIYLIIKFSRFILRSIYYMVVDEPKQKVNHKERRRPADGNVDIDYVPNGKNSRTANQKDDDYVEYEEVK
jgi:hypothetical protein